MTQKFSRLFLILSMVACAIMAGVSPANANPWTGSTEYKLLWTPQGSITMRGPDANGNIHIEAFQDAGDNLPGIARVELDSVPWKTIEKGFYKWSWNIHEPLIPDPKFRTISKRGAWDGRPAILSDGGTHMVKIYISSFRPLSTDESKRGLELPNMGSSATVTFRLDRQAVNPPHVEEKILREKMAAEQAEFLRQQEAARQQPPADRRRESAPGADLQDYLLPETPPAPHLAVEGVNSQGESPRLGEGNPIPVGEPRIFLLVNRGERIKVVYPNGYVSQGTVSNDQVTLTKLPLGGRVWVEYDGLRRPLDIPRDFNGEQTFDLR